MSEPCRHCGRSEEEHCVFEARVMPEGCVCEPRDWPENVTAICEEYVFGPTNNDGYCETCEHNRECHAGAKP